MRFDGKRVLITGGGTGVGADIARGFAEAGAHVIIAGRRAEPLETVAAKLTNTRAVAADVTDEASVERLFQDTGAVDIVIANAGASMAAPIHRTSLADFQSMLAINVVGVFLTFRGGLAQMEPGGRLIAIASIAGLKGSAYTAAYTAAKHGAVGLVRAVALEVAKKGITANAICPGYIESEMTERSIANIMAKTGRSRDEALAALTATNPQGRLIQPAEVTAAALWLASPGAAGINGQAIALTGGEA